MSAFGDKADIIQRKADIKKCPLMTQSGLDDKRLRQTKGRVAQCDFAAHNVPIAQRPYKRCRFQKLDSRVPVMQSAQDCMCDDVSEALNRASVRCILPERNMRTPPVIIGGEFRKDPPQVLFVEHDQMIGTLAPDRPDQAFNMAVLPGRTE